MGKFTNNRNYIEAKVHPNYNPNHSSIDSHISAPNFKTNPKSKRWVFKTAAIGSDRYF